MAFFDTPASTFDPFEQDRMQHMDMLKQAQSNYNASMQAPLGFLDPEMQRFLESKTREEVRAANPKAGGSGWLKDREGTELLKLRMALLDKNLQESNNQRSFMAQLAGQSMPTQQIPGQTGILATAGAKMMGDATGGMAAGLGRNAGDFLSEYLFKKPQATTTAGPAGWQAPYNPNAEGMSTRGWGYD